MLSIKYTDEKTQGFAGCIIMSPLIYFYPIACCFLLCDARGSARHIVGVKAGDPEPIGVTIEIQ